MGEEGRIHGVILLSQWQQHCQDTIPKAHNLFMLYSHRPFVTFNFCLSTFSRTLLSGNSARPLPPIGTLYSRLDEEAPLKSEVFFNIQ